MIGNSKNFAIESQIVGSEGKLERVRLWLKGKALGSFEDENLTGMELGTLINIYRNRDTLEYNDSSSLSFSASFNSLLNDTDSKYICNFGEAFDDFVILASYSNRRFTFYWKLVEPSYFKYPDLNEKKGKVIVDEAVFLSVLKEYEAFLVDATKNTNTPIKPVL